MNSSIQLPEDKVAAYKKAGDQVWQWQRTEKEAEAELEELNRNFFRNARARIRRRVHPVCGWDANVKEARLARSGKPPMFGYISLEVYLGHPGKRARFECYITELGDIDQMCIEANAVYKAFHSVQESNPTQ